MWQRYHQYKLEYNIDNREYAYKKRSVSLTITKVET
jgi:hypothetical protein